MCISVDSVLSCFRDFLYIQPPKEIDPTKPAILINNEAECSINFEPLIAYDEIILLHEQHPLRNQRLHCFESASIKKWLQQNNSCPICRNDNPLVQQYIAESKAKEIFQNF